MDLIYVLKELEILMQKFFACFDETFSETLAPHEETCTSWHYV